MQTYNVLFSYNQQTGQINYNGINKTRGFTGPVINLSEISNPVMAREALGLDDSVKITISDESKALFEQMQEAKQQRELDALSEIYADTGMDAAPKFWDEITATDRALLDMKYKMEADGVTSVFVNHLYKVSYDDNSENHTNFIQEAFGMAVQLEYLSDYFSDDAITKRLDDMNLSDDVDMDVLFQAAKAYGEKAISKLNESDNDNTSAMKQYASMEARYYASFFSGSFDNIADISEPLVKSFESLYTEMVDKARKLISEGYSGDIIEKLKEESFNNSSARFNIKGVGLTLKELDDASKVISNAFSKINDGGNNMSYEELGKFHASVFKEAQESLGWLSNEDSGKLLETLKKGIMTFQLNLKLMGDGTRMIHNAIKSGSLPNNSRINIGEFMRENKTLQSYAKAYEKAFLEVLK